MSSRKSSSASSSVLWLPGMHPDAPLYQPLTLEQYAEETFIPAVSDRLSPDRIGELRQAVHRYKWWSENKDRIMNPVLADVTAGRLSRMRQDCLGADIPGRDGKSRPCSARSLNKTLQAIEQIIAAAIEDGTLDESKGLVRVRKCTQPRQIGKVVIPDSAIAKILQACDTATWPQRTSDGKAIDAPELWRTAVVIYTTYGMRTGDLLPFKAKHRPIRWSCVLPAGLSPAEDGCAESNVGWLTWIPNKTQKTKLYPMTLPLNQTVAYWLRRWRESIKPAVGDALMPVPRSKDSLYAQWKRILAEAGVVPKPKLSFDGAGNAQQESRDYEISHYRCTAGTRANDHGAKIGHKDIGRWVTGHISNDVFEKHYRSQETALVQVLESLPQPVGFVPEPPSPTGTQTNLPPRLRVVG